jgi:hypothetical protein
MLVRPGICTLVRSYVNGIVFDALAGDVSGYVFGRGRV